MGKGPKARPWLPARVTDLRRAAPPTMLGWLHGWKEPRVRVQSRTGPGYLHGALCTSACLVLFRMTPAAPEDGQVAQVASLWQLYPHCIPEVGQGHEGAQQGLPLLPEVGVGFWLMPPSSPGLLPPPPLSSQPQCQVGLALSIAGALVGIWFCHSLAAQPWDSPLSSLCLRSLLCKMRTGTALTSWDQRRPLRVTCECSGGWPSLLCPLLGGLRHPDGLCCPSGPASLTPAEEGRPLTLFPGLGCSPPTGTPRPPALLIGLASVLPNCSPVFYLFCSHVVLPEPHYPALGHRPTGLAHIQFVPS